MPSGCAAVSWGEGRIDLFWIDPDNTLAHRAFNDGAWHDWETLGGELAGHPAASSWGADRIDVWAPGRDGELWHRWWDGTRWVDWERLTS